MEDNEIELAPISEAHLPSWWKHTKEGKKVIGQLATLQAQVAGMHQDLRDAVELLGEFNTCTSLGEMESLLAKVYRFKNRPSVKAVMEGKE